MLLTYSNPRFEVLIKAGVKIHTIREDKHNRWKPEMKIQHWMYNPRNVSKKPYPFSLPGTDILVSKQLIEIEPQIKTIRIDGDRFLNDLEMNQLAFNDGLHNSRVFFKWFNIPFKGYILHFTDKKY